jgi:hypothetical protein
VWWTLRELPLSGALDIVGCAIKDGVGKQKCEIIRKLPTPYARASVLVRAIGFDMVKIGSSTEGDTKRF